MNATSVTKRGALLGRGIALIVASIDAYQIPVLARR